MRQTEEERRDRRKEEKEKERKKKKKRGGGGVSPVLAAGLGAPASLRLAPAVVVVAGSWGEQER